MKKQISAENLRFASRALPGMRTQKAKHPLLVSQERVFSSGDVLLSHNLSSHYHWGCSVSLPCSEWERVGPLRYDHQKAGEAEASPWGKVRGGLYSTLPEILGTAFHL